MPAATLLRHAAAAARRERAAMLLARDIISIRHYEMIFTLRRAIDDFRATV